LVNIFVSLEQVFCYNRSADLHRHSRRRTSLDFFLLRCYISTQILLRRLRQGLRQNHFAKFFCYDALIVQKKCSNVSGEICSVLLRTYNEAKVGLFCFPEASAKRFCFIYIIFFATTNMFSAALVHYRSKSGIDGVLEGHMSAREIGGLLGGILRRTLSLFLLNRSMTYKPGWKDYIWKKDLICFLAKSSRTLFLSLPRCSPTKAHLRPSPGYHFVVFHLEEK
jgi:hypothetical protein